MLFKNDWVFDVSLASLGVFMATVWLEGLVSSLLVFKLFCGIFSD
ncbi:MAG: hypothetical protein Q4E30_02680 [Streptococcus gallolyticus]|uniref:Uncharacterized protein n=1 Tax=Streptococcus gallolyticus TaxID=315405 RepID=A0A139QT32_9STRE|nr:hypothetical protein SGADD03_01626 [Streptococcus gallolyticus]MDO4964379.1 hypothetical protein [Streptococcus gallolyticus]